MATGRPRHDREEFEELVFEHLGALHSFAYRLTAGADDADDLVQETCLRAYRFFDGFQRGTNLRAWLFRILKNTLINEYRRRRAKPVQVEFDEHAERYQARVETLLGQRVENPEEELERTLLARDVEAGLASMPEEYRLVVVLCLVQGFTYQEAADALEIPIGTVMSRLHSGRKFLQARLLDAAQSRGFASVRAAGTEEVEEGEAPPALER